MTQSQPLLAETDGGRYQPTPEELAQAIYDAVLHCIQYKAKAIEAAEQFNKEREGHQ